MELRDKAIATMYSRPFVFPFWRLYLLVLVVAQGTGRSIGQTGTVEDKLFTAADGLTALPGLQLFDAHNTRYSLCLPAVQPVQTGLPTEAIHTKGGNREQVTSQTRWRRRVAGQRQRH